MFLNVNEVVVYGTLKVHHIHSQLGFISPGLNLIWILVPKNTVGPTVTVCVLVVLVLFALF